MTLTPKSCKVVKFSKLCSLVNIVLKELPITAPPRAVFCCTAVMTPTSSLKSTPAWFATDADLFIPSIKSLSETAAAAAADDSLLRISELSSPDFLKELIAAVKPDTDSAAPRPDKRLKTIESFSLFKTSSALRP